MRKQLVGIALILFGNMFLMPNWIFDIWIPIVDTMPWGLIGVILGGAGLYIVIKNQE